MTGTLYLVPTPLDFGCETESPLAASIPDASLRTAATLQHWICENAKSARRFLRRVGEIHPLQAPMQALNIAELPHAIHKFGDGAVAFDPTSLLRPAMEGASIGLVSEAGMPAVADPGASVVRAAHTLGIPVHALPGPTSLMLALASSGLNGQGFAFVGYLPIDPAQRKSRIAELEHRALATRQTQIVIETPYRNQALLDALLDGLKPETWLAVSVGLTLPGSLSRSGPVVRWRVDRPTLPSKVPAVFCVGK